MQLKRFWELKMISKIKNALNSSLIKESLVYGVTNAFYSGLPILILPLLLKVLSPEDYGLVEFFRNLSLVMTPILGLSTVQSITRFYYEYDEPKFKQFVSNIIYLHLFNSIIGVLLLLLLSNFIPEVYSYITLLCIVYFLFNQLTEALLSIFRVCKQAKFYLLFRIGSILLDLGLLVLLYFQFSKFDWTYRVYPNVISTVIIGIIVLIVFYNKNYFLVFNKGLLIKALQYSTPLILHMISGYMMNIGDRFFILYFLSEKELGNYAVSYQLGMLVNFLYTSFNLAWVPTFFSMMKKEQYNRIKKIKKFTYISILIFSFLIILSVYLCLEYTSLFERYDIEITLILIISISYIFNSFYKFEANYFFYNKNTKKLSFITFGAAVITIVMNFALINIYGVYACAIATLISQFYMFFMVSILNKK